MQTSSFRGSRGERRHAIRPAASCKLRLHFAFEFCIDAISCAPKEGGDCASHLTHRLILASILLLLPAAALAQDATLTGTITDATGGVLPGVTSPPRTTRRETPRGVTDQSGAFRLPVRTGVHRVTAELPGFATVTRSLDLLVARRRCSTAAGAVSRAGSVTVTGEAPLIDTVSSTVGANVDPRQMQTCRSTAATGST